MDMLIVEDVALLLLDDRTGRFAASSGLTTVLGGAVLTELALAEHVWVEPRTGFWSTAKVHVVPGAPAPVDPLLLGALGVVAERPRGPQDLVGRLGKDLRDHVVGRLAERGLVRREDDTVLGLFPTTRWPARDVRHEQELRGGIELVLGHGAAPDPRTGAVIALLSAVDQAHRVLTVPGVPPREVKARAKRVGEGDWAAKAVRDAIAATNAAVIAGITAAAAAGTT